MNIDVSGKVVIVTGGNSGIGEGIAKGFAKEGCMVAIFDMNDETRVVDEIKADGGKAIVCKANVTDEASVNAAVEETLKAFNGRIDILINCAGLAKNPSQIWNMKQEDWQLTMDVDVTGLFVCSKAVVETMKKQRWGRIINFSSQAGKRITQHSGIAYTTAKAAVLGFNRHLGVELAAYGITVNAICPGAVVTAMTRKVWSEEVIKQREQMIPVGRMPNPEDMFLMCLFFASEQASMVNAQDICVDGGSLISYFDNKTYHEKMGDPLPAELQ